MKSLIKGKTYDTDSAEYVDSYTNGYTANDFKLITEDLYLSPQGQWFLEIYGGPMTPYAESHGSDLCGNRFIKLISPDRAKQWLENHGDTETYLKHFEAEQG